MSKKLRDIFIFGQSYGCSKINTSGDFIDGNNWWKFRLNPTCTDKDMKRQKSPISRQYYLKRPSHQPRDASAPQTFKLNFTPTARVFEFNRGRRTKNRTRWCLCVLRHAIQISMEAILACHPARSTEWLDCHPKSCEPWRIRTGPIYILFTTLHSQLKITDNEKRSCWW